MGEEVEYYSSPDLLSHGAEHHPLGCPSPAFPICSYREGVEKVLGELSLFSEEVAFGKTKIFIRSPKTVS